MNFQDLKKIEQPQHYLDVAFKKASKKTDELRNKVKIKDRLSKSKNLEITRMEITKTVLAEQLSKIMKSYPNIDGLDVFYKELIKCTLDYSDLKKSLGSVKWATEKINYLFKINTL